MVRMPMIGTARKNRWFGKHNCNYVLGQAPAVCPNIYLNVLDDKGSLNVNVVPFPLEDKKLTSPFKYFSPNNFMEYVPNPLPILDFVLKCL